MGTHKIVELSLVEGEEGKGPQLELTLEDGTVLREAMHGPVVVGQGKAKKGKSKDEP